MVAAVAVCQPLLPSSMPAPLSFMVSLLPPVSNDFPPPPLFFLLIRKL